MIRLTRSGLMADEADVVRLRKQFQTENWVLLPNLLEPRLLDFVLTSIDGGEWREYVREAFDKNCILDPCPAVTFLHFITNQREFLDLAQRITGSGPFTWFGGLVYRMTPDSGHHDAWHTDDIDGQRAAFSLNLSRRGFKGGHLQMKERGSERILAEIANCGLGDAVLFRISGNLLHRVTEVEDAEPKTAFAGWFTDAAPTFADRIHSLTTLQATSSLRGH